LIDWFSEIQTQTDQQQNFGYWDPTDEFSKQAAMQQSLQDQLQQTNILLNAVPNSTQPSVHNAHASNPFGSSDPFAGFNTPASPPVPTLSTSTTPAMNSHNPFGIGVSTSGMSSQVVQSAHNPFLFNANPAGVSKQLDPNFNVESVFGPGSPVSVQSFPAPVPAYSNTQTLPISNHDPFTQMKQFGTPGLHNQVTGSSTPGSFRSPQMGSSTPGQTANRPMFPGGMTSMSAPNPFVNSNPVMGSNMGAQMNSFGMMGSSGMAGMNLMNSGYNSNTMSNYNPFSGTQQPMNSTQMTPFSNNAGLGSGPFYGTNTGSNQGSVFSNFHAQSTNLNNTLGSFSATSSPLPSQGSQFPRGLPAQQNNFQAFNNVPQMNTNQATNSNQNPFAYP
jgi:hypothetical protein